MRARLAVFLLLLVATALPVSADFLVVSRPATIKNAPHRDALVFLRVEKGTELILVQGEKENGYYKVQVPGSSAHGWIYKTLARRHPGMPEGQPEQPGEAPEALSVCSFNIQFLRFFKKKKNEALANYLKQFDIVVVQELTAPPTAGTYPDGTAYTADAEAKAFFDEMEAWGFSYELSPEDTGPGESNHTASSATEWFVTFYNENVELADDLFNEFLASDRTAHGTYKRVPYASSFRTTDGNFDFVLISVHLTPNDSEAAARKKELKAIAKWIDDNDATEKDFLVLGDMNFKNKAEITDATPSGFTSLNDEARKTNTATTAKPYDNVMYRAAHTTELDTAFDLDVDDLIEEMRASWDESGDYVGDPYNHNAFKQRYSDHHPVVFRLTVPGEDDD